jgi:TIR domain
MLGGVFISYRREDSGGFAGRIYDRLTNRLGRENVFFDVDAIPPGLDFVDVLSDHVGKCDALLAVIGKHWVSSADSQNRRRLDDPSDFVRIEIEAALQRNVPVIPVLVDGAAMPQAGNLPDGLKKLTRRQAIEVSHNRFDSDAERLTEALSQLEDELRQRDAAKAQPTAQAGTAPGATAAEPGGAARPKAAEMAANRAVAPSGPEARVSAPPGQAKRTLVILVALGLALAAGAVALLPRSRSHDAKIAGSDATSGSPQTAPAAVAPPSNAVQPDQWLALSDFKAEFNQEHSAGNYPDMTSGRCQDGVLQYRAHFVQRPPTFSHFFNFGLAQDKFNARNDELTSQGYAIQYQNTFQDC